MKRWLFLAVLGLAGAALFLRYYDTTTTEQQERLSTEATRSDRIAGIGRLEPDDGIILLNVLSRM